MTTPIHTAEALELIQIRGLNNAEYNIELKNIEPYGATNRTEELPPHVAVFLDENFDALDDWPPCDCLLQTRELGDVAVYLF